MSTSGHEPNSMSQWLASLVLMEQGHISSLCTLIRSAMVYQDNDGPKSFHGTSDDKSFPKSKESQPLSLTRIRQRGAKHFHKT